MLGMNADDDGFVGSPKRIMQMSGIKQNAYNELLKNNYIIPFRSGVIVIKHWVLQNKIQPDRYKKTIYQNEFSELILNDTKVYELTTKNSMNNNCIQNVNNLETQYSLDKNSLDKNSLDKIQSDMKKHKYGEYQNVLLSDEDMEKLKSEFPNDYQKQIEKLSGYIESTGKKYKNHLATIRNWAKRNNEKSSNNAKTISEHNISAIEDFINKGYTNKQQ